MQIRVLYCVSGSDCDANCRTAVATTLGGDWEDFLLLGAGVGKFS